MSSSDPVLRSRWRKLVRTRTAGEPLFVCLVCGHTASADNLECPPFKKHTDTGDVTRCCTVAAYREIDDDG